MNLKILDNKIKTQYLGFLFIYLIILGLTVILELFENNFFKRFIGELNPIAAILISGILGGLLLFFLLLKKWFAICKKENLKKAISYSWLVVLFVSVSIIIDWNITYPKEMNIPFPEALLFYPVIGFFVEVIFHVLPITMLLILTTSIFTKTSVNKLIWISILIVSAFEPTYQVFFMDFSPIWSMIVLWVNLFLFNLTQLIIFKQFDFVSMFLFRIIYYILWHVIWGYFRLEILF